MIPIVSDRHLEIQFKSDIREPLGQKRGNGVEHLPEHEFLSDGDEFRFHGLRAATEVAISLCTYDMPLQADVTADDIDVWQVGEWICWKG
jgi:hypothetical protein